MKNKNFKSQLRTTLAMSGLKEEELLTKLNVTKERLNELLDGNVPSIKELEGIMLVTGTDINIWLNVILDQKLTFLSSKLQDMLKANDEESIIQAFAYGKILIVEDNYYERYLSRIDKLEPETVKQALKVLFKHSIKLAKRFSTSKALLSYEDLKEYDISSIYDYITYSSHNKKFVLTSFAKNANAFIKSCPVEIKQKLLDILYNDIKEFSSAIPEKNNKKFGSEDKVYITSSEKDNHNTITVIDLNYDFSAFEGCDESISKINELLNAIESFIKRTFK